MSLSLTSVLFSKQHLFHPLHRPNEDLSLRKRVASVALAALAGAAVVPFALLGGAAIVAGISVLTAIGTFYLVTALFKHAMNKKQKDEPVDKAEENKARSRLLDFLNYSGIQDQETVTAAQKYPERQKLLAALYILTEDLITNESVLELTQWKTGPIRAAQILRSEYSTQEILTPVNREWIEGLKEFSPLHHIPLLLNLHKANALTSQTRALIAQWPCDELYRLVRMTDLFAKAGILTEENILRAPRDAEKQQAIKVLQERSLLDQESFEMILTAKGKLEYFESALDILNARELSARKYLKKIIDSQNPLLIDKL